MKTIYIIAGAIFLLFQASTGHAQQLPGYAINASSAGTTISGGVSHPASASGKVSILVRTDATSGAPGETANIASPGFVALHTLTDGSYEIGNLAPETTHYLDLVEKLPNDAWKILAKTSTATKKGFSFFYEWPLTVTPNGEKVILKGKIDTAKYSSDDIDSLKISIYITPIGTPFNEGEDPENHPTKRGPWHATPSATAAAFGVNPSTGEYFVTLDGLTPGQKYFYAQKIAKGSEFEVKIKEFDSSKGYLSVVQAQNDLEKRSYRLLAPLPGLAVLFDPDLCLELISKGKISPDNPCTQEDPSGLNGFINYFVKLLVGLAAVFLVIRIIMEGYNYVVTDTPLRKATAKSNLWEAVGGLVVALTAYLLLNTINPKLLSNQISIQKLELGVEDLEGDNESYQSGLSYAGGTSGVAGYNVKNAIFPNGIMCPGKTGGTGDVATIAKSFVGKVTYNQLQTDKNNKAGYPSRGNPGPNSTFMLDCSSYVTTVLQCAGIVPAYQYAQTSLIFKGKEKITGGVEVKNGVGYINGKELKPGDLIGWTSADKVVCSGSRCSGHVVIYIGNGQIMESVGGKGRSPGKSVIAPHSLEIWKTQYRWIYRISG